MVKLRVGRALRLVWRGRGWARTREGGWRQGRNGVKVIFESGESSGQGLVRTLGEIGRSSADAMTRKRENHALSLRNKPKFKGSRQKIVILTTISSYLFSLISCL